MERCSGNMQHILPLWIAHENMWDILYIPVQSIYIYIHIYIYKYTYIYIYKYIYIQYSDLVNFHALQYFTQHVVIFHLQSMYNI